MPRFISKRLLLGSVVLGLFVTGSHAQQADRYNYQWPTEVLINAGTQALLMCNGLFVSNRSLDQIYEAELKLNMMPALPPNKVTIDRERKAVAVGELGNGRVPVMRAAYREGLGCVV